MGSGGPGPRALGGPLRFRGEAFRLVPGVPGKPPPGMPGSGGPGPRFDGVPGCDGPNDLGVPVFGVPLPPGVPKPGPGGPRPMEPGSSGAMVCFASSKTCGSGNACISWSAMYESGASPVPGSERIGSCEVPPMEASCRSGNGVGGGPVVGQLKGGNIPAGVAVLAFFGGGGYFGGGGRGMRPDIPGTAGSAKFAPRPGTAGGNCNC
mmetsp:Transcript_65104/g.142739  ORF Transcript_65104/g.142739 Transcript_65104/m.142739 type:complete len:207 (-) Transcript_65104:1462-2082(-)